MGLEQLGRLAGEEAERFARWMKELELMADMHQLAVERAASLLVEVFLRLLEVFEGCLVIAALESRARGQVNAQGQVLEPRRPELGEEIHHLT